MNAWVMAVMGRGHRLLLILSLITVATIGLAAPARKIGELNFINAEIPLVLKALADFSGSNIVVGPAVKGQITVRLKDVTVEDALEIITKMSGLNYARVDNAYVVNPTVIFPDDKNWGYTVVDLKHLAAKEAIAALGVAFHDVQVKELGTRVVLAGNTKRVEAAKAFLADIDTPAVKTQPVDLVVTLKNITLAEATKSLGLIYKDVTATTVGESRLVLSGDKARVDAAKSFLAELDTPVGPGVLVKPDIVEATYDVKYVVPWQAKEYLETVFRGRELTVSYAPNLLDHQVTGAVAPEAPKAAPDAAGAAKMAAESKAAGWGSRALVLRGPSTVVKDALASLARVDVEAKLAEKRYTVKRIFPSHAIAYLLDRYESRGLVIVTAPLNVKNETEAASSKPAGGQIGAVVRRDADGKLNVSEPIGDLILRGSEDLVAAAMTTLQQIDVGPERVDKVVQVRYLKAENVQKQLATLYGAQGLLVVIAPSQPVEPLGKVQGVLGDEGVGGGGGGGSGASATAESRGEEIAHLILRGPETIVTQAADLIARLDTEPPMVSVKTQIVSIASSATKNLGIAWSSAAGQSSVSASLTEQPSGNPLELGRIVRSPVSLTATLNALESQNKAKIVNRPASVVRNGRVAFIHVGDVITYETFQGVDATGNRLYSTETLTTGVTLYVRPLVSENGLITLEIMSGVTNRPTFRISKNGSELPQIRETSNTTVVQIRDGETLVIGGLMQETQEETVQRVSGLSRIPLLGALFTNKTAEPSQTELLIMVTPSILTANSQTAAPAPAVQ